MIHFHCFPSYSADNVWTIYAPKIPTDLNVEWIAKFVHSELRNSIIEKRSEFTVGFMPENWKPNDEEEFSYEGRHYVVVTKDELNILTSIPELISVENKHTLFVVPNYSPPLHVHQELDSVSDASRILFWVILAIVIFSWFYANFVYK